MRAVLRLVGMMEMQQFRSRRGEEKGRFSGIRLRSIGVGIMFKESVLEHNVKFIVSL